MTADERLYEKAVRAMKRYASNEPMPRTELGEAFYKVKYEMFRIGWMMGYRAGRRAKR